MVAYCLGVKTYDILEFTYRHLGNSVVYSAKISVRIIVHLMLFMGNVGSLASEEVIIQLMKTK